LLFVPALFVVITFLSAVVSIEGAPLKMCPLLFAIETLFVLPLIVAAAVYIVIVSAALTIAVPLNLVSLALVSLKPTLVGIVIVKVLWCPV
jgi:hypothetical protein